MTRLFMRDVLIAESIDQADVPYKILSPDNIRLKGPVDHCLKRNREIPEKNLLHRGKVKALFLFLRQVIDLGHKVESDPG